MSLQDKTPLEELQDSLYNRNHSPQSKKRRVIHAKDFSVPEAWDEPENVDGPIGEEIPRNKIPYGILIISVCIFVSAILFAWYKTYLPTDRFSQDNIYFTVSAPEYIDGGQEFNVPVQLRNENMQGLQLVTVEVSYAQGSEEDSPKVIRVEKSIGDVEKKSIQENIFPITLYGIPESKRIITARLTYVVPGSSATFQKEATQTIIIKSSPLALSIDTIESVTPGQEMEVKVRLEALKGKEIKDVTIQAVYPTGFQYVDADIKPTRGTNTWSFGALKAGDVREIKIRGIVRGEDAEVRALTFIAGTLDENTNDFMYQYILEKKEYTLIKPFLETRILVNGRDARTLTANAGADIEVQIEWKNNLPTTLQNVELALTIDGAFIENTIRTNTGFYDSQKNTVIWTKTKDSSLGSVKPGASGKVDVRFSAQELNTLTDQGTITLVSSAKARRVGEINISETVSAGVRSEIKLATRLAFRGAVRRTGTQFTNTMIGTVPPRAEQETSYVLEYTIQNTVNPVEKAEVRFVLPLGVRHIENQSSQGTVVYSDSNRDINWNVGSISKGGTGNDAKLFVHVAVTPSITDIGRALVLANNASLTAIDTFTKNRITIQNKNILTTKFEQNDGFKKGDDVVTR